MRRRLRAAAGWGLLLFGWTWVVCFPNPLVLPRNLYRYFRFPVDPGVADAFPQPLPDAPVELERLVKERVAFQWDWVTYGVPWMMPAPGDVVRRGVGDCESVAVVLASLLEAKGIPYNIEASFSHVWIDYPGRVPNHWEQSGAAYFGHRDGHVFLQPPRVYLLRQHLRVQKEGLWDVMPGTRKVLLLLGWLGLPLVGLQRGRAIRARTHETRAAAPEDAAAGSG